MSEDGIVMFSTTGLEFIIDEEDYERVSKHNWWFNNGSLYAHIDAKTICLSRYILDVVDPRKKVLRKNNKTLDFRKCNLYAGNIYVKRGDCFEVECYAGEKFLISASDKPLIEQYQWHADKNNYVITKTKDERVIKLHRLILGVVNDTNVEVDHINRDTLDNRRENLRLANRSLNCFNRDVSKYNKSGKVGVYPMSGYDDKWCAQINCNGVRLYLGSFNSFDSAVAAREAAESRLYNT